jgi:hypothetical protein
LEIRKIWSISVGERIFGYSAVSVDILFRFHNERRCVYILRNYIMLHLFFGEMFPQGTTGRAYPSLGKDNALPAVTFLEARLPPAPSLA